MLSSMFSPSITSNQRRRDVTTIVLLIDYILPLMSSSTRLAKPSHDSRRRIRRPMTSFPLHTDLNLSRYSPPFIIIIIRSLLLVFFTATTLHLILLQTCSAKAPPTAHMSPHVVQTQYGKIRGILVNLPNRSLPPVEVYLGIQFASLLGGELRFMPPTSSMEKWEGVRVALKFRPVCPQRVPNVEELQRKMPAGRVDHFKRILPYLERQSEECLNLNIYVPAAARDGNATSSKEVGGLSVVVFIHAETYELGTGNAYDGSVLASYGHVIVVTLNYRLGPLGFLSTGDGTAPGNYALLDQVAALHWIKENIAAFGGNPNSVTLIGQGYGGSLVNLLMISPVTRGRNLFQRAIIQSGTALATWSVVIDPWTYTRRLAEAVNCTTPSPSPSPATSPSPSSSSSSSSSVPSTADILRCLSHVPAVDLVQPHIEAPKYFSSFGPTIDYRSVLPASLRRLMSKPGESVFSTTPLLLGVTKNEGIVFFNQRKIDEGFTADDVQKYGEWERPVDEAALRDCSMELLGDGQYVAPVVELTRLHARLAATTYLYAFNYVARTDAYPRWAGGVHGDEMTFVFGAPLTDGLEPFPSVYSRSDKALSETVLKFWINFIKTGNPNEPAMTSSSSSPSLPMSSAVAAPGGRQRSKGHDHTVDWLPYDLEAQNIFYIERKMQDRLEEGMKSPVRHHYRGSKVALWLDLIPRLHKSDDLDSRFHLLEDSYNQSTFETEGTRPIDWSDTLSTPPTPLPTTSALTLNYDITREEDMEIKTLPEKGISRGDGKPSPSSPVVTRSLSAAEDKDETSSVPPAGSVLSFAVPPRVLVAREEGVASSRTLSLGVTLVVGCSLLFLNALVFAAVCYQRDRVRRERRLVKLELEQEQELFTSISQLHHQQQQLQQLQKPKRQQNGGRRSLCSSAQTTRSSIVRDGCSSRGSPDAFTSASECSPSRVVRVAMTTKNNHVNYGSHAPSADSSHAPTSVDSSHAPSADSSHALSADSSHAPTSADSSHAQSSDRVWLSNSSSITSSSRQVGVNCTLKRSVRLPQPPPLPAASAAQYFTLPQRVPPSTSCNENTALYLRPECNHVFSPANGRATFVENMAVDRGRGAPGGARVGGGPGAGPGGPGTGAGRKSLTPSIGAADDDDDVIACNPTTTV